jgi:hypothetical protein
VEPLRLVHHHPGRLRLRSPVFEQDDQVIYLVRDALRRIPAVTRVGHNRYTGSVVVEYHPGQVEPDALLSAIALAAGAGSVVDEALVRRRSADAAIGVIKAARSMSGVAHEVTGQDVGVLVPAALLASAVWSFVRAPVLPRWDNLLYWSWTVFHTLNHHKIHPNATESSEEEEPL